MENSIDYLISIVFYTHKPTLLSCPSSVCFSLPVSALFTFSFATCFINRPNHRPHVLDVFAHSVVEHIHSVVMVSHIKAFILLLQEIIIHISQSHLQFSSWHQLSHEIYFFCYQAIAVPVSFVAFSLLIHVLPNQEYDSMTCLSKWLIIEIVDSAWGDKVSAAQRHINMTAVITGKNWIIANMAFLSEFCISSAVEEKIVYAYNTIKSPSWNIFFRHTACYLWQMLSMKTVKWVV